MAALSRKEVLIIYSWTSLVGLFIAFGGIPPILLTIELMLSMSSIGYCVYFYNDVCDLEDDLTSKKYGYSTPASRPLGLGLISKKTILSFSLFFLILGVFFSYMINLQILILQAIFLSLGFLYSTEPFRLKKRFVLKQLTISLGGAISCILGGFALGILSPQVLYFTLLSFILFFFVNPIIDLRDMEGDKIVGVKTFPVIWGPKFTIRLAIVMLSSAVIANIVGFLRLGFNFAFPILGAIVLGGTIYVIYPLMNKWNDVPYLNNTITKKMYPLFLFLQLTFLFGLLKI